MDINIREYTGKDSEEVMKIWNEVVSDGVAFPQEELLTEDSADDFFRNQTYTGVAEDSTSGEILSECTFYIRIMSDDVDIFVMRPMRLGRIYVVSI